MDLKEPLTNLNNFVKNLEKPDEEDLIDALNFTDEDKEKTLRGIFDKIKPILDSLSTDLFVSFRIHAENASISDRERKINADTYFRNLDFILIHLKTQVKFLENNKSNLNLVSPNSNGNMDYIDCMRSTVDHLITVVNTIINLHDLTPKKYIDGYLYLLDESDGSKIVLDFIKQPSQIILKKNIVDLLRAEKRTYMPQNQEDHETLNKRLAVLEKLSPEDGKLKNHVFPGYSYNKKQLLKLEFDTYKTFENTLCALKKGETVENVDHLIEALKYSEGDFAGSSIYLNTDNLAPYKYSGMFEKKGFHAYNPEDEQLVFDAIAKKLLDESLTLDKLQNSDIANNRLADFQRYFDIKHAKLEKDVDYLLKEWAIEIHSYLNKYKDFHVYLTQQTYDDIEKTLRYQPEYGDLLARCKVPKHETTLSNGDLRFGYLDNSVANKSTITYEDNQSTNLVLDKFGKMLEIKKELSFDLENNGTEDFEARKLDMLIHKTREAGNIFAKNAESLFTKERNPRIKHRLFVFAAAIFIPTLGIGTAIVALAAAANNYRTIDVFNAGFFETTADLLMKKSFKEAGHKLPSPDSLKPGGPGNQ